MSDVREIVTEYIRAVGDRRFDRFEELLHPEVEFGGTTVAELRGASVVAEGYRRLGPIVLRNDIKELVVDGDRAAVLYDFVTDTEAKAVLTAEFLTIEDGSIRSITLLFDWRAWPTVLEELQRGLARGSDRRRPPWPGARAAPDTPLRRPCPIGSKDTSLVPTRSTGL